MYICKMSLKICIDLNSGYTSIKDVLSFNTENNEKDTLPFDDSTLCGSSSL
jgi:hypothetical protein